MLAFLFTIFYIGLCMICVTNITNDISMNYDILHRRFPITSLHTLSHSRLINKTEKMRFQLEVCTCLPIQFSLRSFNITANIVFFLRMRGLFVLLSHRLMGYNVSMLCLCLHALNTRVYFQLSRTWKFLKVYFVYILWIHFVSTL